MKNILKIMPIFSINMFFSICSIIGYSYGGSDSSSIYKIYMFLIFIFSLIFFLYQLVVKKIIKTKGQVLVLIIPFIVTLIFLVNEILAINNYNTTKYFMYFIIFSVPAIFMGIYVAQSNKISSVSKNMELVMLIFTVAVMITTIKSLSSGERFNSIGGETYQFASYLAAFSFGINIYYLVYGTNHERFRFTSTKIYKLCCYVLLMFQLCGVFIAGGRGGFVLIIAYLIYIALSLLDKKHSKRIIKYIFIVGIFLLVISILFPYLLNIESFNNSFNRVFSYISTDGVDWSGTNRDLVYAEAIYYIKQKPLLGYGLFNWASDNYPHNFILEILLNGGILYLFFWIFVLINLVTKLSKIIKYDSETRIIKIIFLYPLLMLMFSGTYTINTIFWFCISFIFAYEIPQNIKSKITKNM
ncbi:MAG: hypothetical protein DBY38_00165 [Clostridium cadaveris]|uniref:O-antigen ligase-related domain-containing protein n=1 Tax=Clostridium cadaveris TaxID=1529 RepID=A0A316MBJ6_9CLOT|nr:MAG: hypothetical protein DBY38_00165 [Clostridium cadaveris]